MGETEVRTMQTAFLRSPHTGRQLDRRRKNGYMLRTSFVHTLALFLLVLLSLCGPAHAADAGTGATRLQKIRGRFILRGDTFNELSASQPDIYRRQQGGDERAAGENDTITKPSASSGRASDSTPSSIASAPVDSSSPLPTPFDGGLGKNYTQPSCPTFLKAMINNDTFVPCLPFSLLLQNSMSFFSASKSLPSITRTLNTSCDVDFQACSRTMASYAQTLRSSSACGQDYEREQPFVRQAHAGLLSYDVLYKASCIRNEASEDQNDTNYCFADAVTNMTSPTDGYAYYLPLGIPLPAGTLPTCDGCLKRVMDVFAGTASNKTQPLSQTYVNAARQVNQACGPNFVNGTIPGLGASGSGQSSGALPVFRHPGWHWPVMILAAVVFFGK